MSWLNDHLVALKPDITLRRAQGEDVLFFFCMVIEYFHT